MIDNIINDFNKQTGINNKDCVYNTSDIQWRPSPFAANDIDLLFLMSWQQLLVQKENTEIK